MSRLIASTSGPASARLTARWASGLAATLSTTSPAAFESSTTSTLAIAARSTAWPAARPPNRTAPAAGRTAAAPIPRPNRSAAPRPARPAPREPCASALCKWSVTVRVRRGFPPPFVIAHCNCAEASQRPCPQIELKGSTQLRPSGRPFRFGCRLLALRGELAVGARPQLRRTLFGRFRGLLPRRRPGAGGPRLDQRADEV